MESTKEQRLGQGAVFACAVLWSTSGLGIKLLDWHPVVISGARSLVAAIFLLGVRFLNPNTRKRKFHIPSLLPAAIANTLVMITFVIANKLTASANVILLQYIAPVWAAVLGWFLIKEKIRKKHWVAMALTMIGLFIFFWDGLAIGSFLGDSVALFSGLCFGTYSVLLRMHKDGNPVDAILLSHFICAAASAVFVFFYPPAPSPASAGIILFLGIIQTGAASLLFAYGIKRINAAHAMLTAMIEPILNPVWVLLATGEKPSLMALAGGGIIVAAVLITAINGKDGGNDPGSNSQ